MRQRFDAVQLVLEIIRENGLIVLALGALIWQVWMTNTTCRQEAERWRAVIDSMRTAQIERDNYERAVNKSWLDTMVSMREAVSRNGEIAREAVARMKCMEPASANQPGRN